MSRRQKKVGNKNTGGQESEESKTKVKQQDEQVTHDDTYGCRGRKGKATGWWRFGLNKTQGNERESES